MLNLPVGTKVTCSYRAFPYGPIGGHVGEIAAPAPGEANYCKVGNRTPVRYPFGTMLDSDDSLIPVDDEAADIAYTEGPSGLTRANIGNF